MPAVAYSPIFSTLSVLSLAGDTTSMTIFRYEAGSGRRSGGAQLWSAASGRLIGATWRVASDRLPVDDFYLAAELLGQVAPDLFGDRLRLEIPGCRPVVD